MCDCSGLPDRTTLRRVRHSGGHYARPDCSGLPDRTTLRRYRLYRSESQRSHCSGLPDRTTLRPANIASGLACRSSLFRSSRPDYIETSCAKRHQQSAWMDCSGLPDRTTLRHVDLEEMRFHPRGDCSGLPDRTTLRLRADLYAGRKRGIVPVFQTGLH